MGAQVPTKFLLGLVGHRALGGSPGVPFPPAPQGPFCCHHLFLHGRGWHRGVDPLPEGAPGAEGVLFPKQAGTRAGGSGWAQEESEIPPARMHPCSSQSFIATVLGLSFLLGDEKNLFKLFLSCFLGSLCPAPADPGRSQAGLCHVPGSCPSPWGEQDSVPSPALHRLLGLFPLGFLSLWDYPGQLLAGEQEGFLLSQVLPLCLFLPHLKGQQQVKINRGKAL